MCRLDLLLARSVLFLVVVRRVGTALKIEKSMVYAARNPTIVHWKSTFNALYQHCITWHDRRLNRHRLNQIIRECNLTTDRHDTATSEINSFASQPPDTPDMLYPSRELSHVLQSYHGSLYGCTQITIRRRGHTVRFSLQCHLSAT